MNFLDFLNFSGRTPFCSRLPLVRRVGEADLSWLLSSDEEVAEEEEEVEVADDDDDDDDEEVEDEEEQDEDDDEDDELELLTESEHWSV